MLEQPVATVTYTQLVPRQSFEASFRFTVDPEPDAKKADADVVERPPADEQKAMVDKQLHNDSKTTLLYYVPLNVIC